MREENTPKQTTVTREMFSAPLIICADSNIKKVDFYPDFQRIMKCSSLSLSLAVVVLDYGLSQDSSAPSSFYPLRAIAACYSKPWPD
jgi:hypothetical protein